MSDHEPDRKERKRERVTLSGEDARQGEIILRTRARRIIFIAGLVGVVLLAVLIRFAMR
ncbi:peptide ABC transporter permease [Mesorhizobium sp. SP-1A]|uniref:peptide ABC transporter permease n=1 Tax=Mesorhizobium sp. SP-1A TaxID=3077840 RepID=UPI0028F6DA6E|nr:peptide ABC transporter permease [Mesorhizobium sp. SP-1A]